MMERLRDEPRSQDPVATEMARLIRLAGSSDPDMERRVRARLLSDDEPHRRRAPVLAFYVVAVTLVLVSSTVAGAWIVRAAKRHFESAQTITPDEPTPSIMPPRGVAIAQTTRIPVEATTPSPVTTPPPQPPVAPAIPRPVQPAPHAPAPAPIVVDKPAAPGPISPATQPPPSVAPAVPAPADPIPRAVLVSRARLALRRDNDPRRAIGLVERYLRENPDGPLVEEALALSIDASYTLGDRHAASTAAAEYMRRFPAGRFADLANRARQIDER